MLENMFYKIRNQFLPKEFKSRMKRFKLSLGTREAYTNFLGEEVQKLGIRFLPRFELKETHMIIEKVHHILTKKKFTGWECEIDDMNSLLYSHLKQNDFFDFHAIDLVSPAILKGHLEKQFGFKILFREDYERMSDVRKDDFELYFPYNPNIKEVILFSNTSHLVNIGG